MNAKIFAFLSTDHPRTPTKNYRSLVATAQKAIQTHGESWRWSTCRLVSLRVYIIVKVIVQQLIRVLINNNGSVRLKEWRGGKKGEE